MTIRYSNGYNNEAILLSRTEDSLRVVTKGSDDIVELKQINGAWITEDCEPVQVEFAWMQHDGMASPTEADCICSHELAAELIHLLFAGENHVEAPAALAQS